jgi:hypothetical protein
MLLVVALAARCGACSWWWRSRLGVRVLLVVALAARCGEP